MRYSILAIMMLMVVDVSAVNMDFYVSNSALNEGNWAKIEVSNSGMQYISDATLASLGFSNPETVNVYGYGGRLLPEVLNSQTLIDDLPLIPSMRVNGGIIFFGHGSVDWAMVDGVKTYGHTSHAYSDQSYYFLSDKASGRPDAEDSENPATAAGSSITTFTERLLHEEDLLAPSNMGRVLYGEDFRTQKSRNYRFNLNGNTGDATVTVQFGSRTSSGISSISMLANGKRLEASSEDQMSYSDSKFVVNALTTKKVESPGSTLDLTVEFIGSGSVSFAALDYIEIEYPREINLGTGQLYFYLNPEEASEVTVAGASASSIVWDVTDPIKPRKVTTKFSGNSMTFVAPSGYGEYVAFDPQRISNAVVAAGRIENQNIHGIDSPELLIISPPQFLEVAERLVAFHEASDGIQTLVLTPEEIYNEFSSGKPDVTAFRKLLKMWYDRRESADGRYAKYCLILGRPSYDNKMVTVAVKNSGYPRVPIWQHPTAVTEAASYSTDDYVGMLDDVENSFNIGQAVIHTAVGRMPIKNVREGLNAVSKLEKYVSDPSYGSWRNNIMVIADDQDNGTHLDQAETAIEAMKSNPDGVDVLYEKLYLDSYELKYTGTGPSYPDAHTRMMDKINEGVAFIDYIGHANTRGWGHENLLTWTELTSMKNQYLPIMYAATCEFMRWDADEVSGAEEMWLNPEAGVINMICPSRSVLISSNGILNKATSQYLFQRDEAGKFMSVGDLMVRGKNASSTGANKLRYGLMGDPSMRLPWADYKVKVDAINDIDLASAEEYPVVQARSSMKISGHVSTSDGQPIDDFNGVLEIQLYDAERAITTNGNGTEGVESVYNDRKTRLFKGRVKVTGGKWSTVIMMPTEIENNYSPALVSLYAFDENGREANGSCEQFYVYGYDVNAPEDKNGPEILQYYLDTPAFVSGQGVSPNPVLTAIFRDDSGISVSEAGIGHNITLEMDGKMFFHDISLFYMPDEEDPTKGSLIYPLQNLEEGNHSLKFTVWDNANNSTTAVMEFHISALWTPSIELLTVDASPAKTEVNFLIATDGTSDGMECLLEVFDLNGRKVWSTTTTALNGSNSRTVINWNLNDSGGNRVARGIYLYRATITTANGSTVRKSRKLAVAAP